MATNTWNETEEKPRIIADSGSHQALGHLLKKSDELITSRFL
jgi:hypothetical protein